MKLQKGNRAKGFSSLRPGQRALQSLETTVAHRESLGLGTKDEGENKLMYEETGPARWHSSKGACG